jgi:hypothetical protein
MLEILLLDFPPENLILNLRSFSYKPLNLDSTSQFKSWYK